MKLLKTWFHGVRETFLGKHGYMIIVSLVGAYIGLYSIMEARFERAMSRATFERQAFMQVVSSGSFVVAMKNFGPVQNVVVPQEPTLWTFWAWFKTGKPNKDPLHRWAVHFFPLCRGKPECGGGGAFALELSGADLRVADLTHTTGLTREQIDSAIIIIDENTKLPDYLKEPGQTAD